MKIRHRDYIWVLGQPESCVGQFGLDLGPLCINLILKLHHMVSQHACFTTGQPNNKCLGGNTQWKSRTITAAAAVRWQMHSFVCSGRLKVNIIIICSKEKVLWFYISSLQHLIPKSRGSSELQMGLFFYGSIKQHSTIPPGSCLSPWNMFFHDPL